MKKATNRKEVEKVSAGKEEEEERGDAEEKRKRR